MHILIIPSEEYIPKHLPLAGIFQHDQAKILQQNGHQVGALSFTFKYSVSSLLNVLIGRKTKHTKALNFGSSFQLLIKKILLPYSSTFIFETIDNISVVRCDGFWWFKKNNRPLSSYEMWLKYGQFTLKYYIQKFGKPDIIHTHNMIYAGICFSELSEKFNVPIVITEHSTEFALKEQTKDISKKINTLLKHHDSKLLAVSPKLIELLNLKFFNSKQSKIEWLPNVLDTRFEESVKFKSEYNIEKVRFFNLANLIPVKGQKELISAFAKAFKYFDDVELLIAGNGVLKVELEKLIDELELNDKVKLIGLINRDEVIKQLDNCDVFVLPSYYETFGVVLIEALSRGVPVISTFCDGPECIVNKSNGILVQPKNVDELAQALVKMYHEHNNYNKEQLREDVIKLYGKEVFYQRVMEIYKSAL
jgi:glycosyltransferase involved in cell wall biosynthesis